MSLKKKINKVEAEVRAKQEEVSIKLDELRDQLIGDLAAHFLGEIGKTELEAVRREIETAERFLREAPLVLGGLAKQREALERDEPADRRHKSREEALRDYEALKAEVAGLNQYDQGVEVRLSALAGDCRRRGEAEEVVKA